MESGFVQWINISGQNKRGEIVQIYDGSNMNSWWYFVIIILIIFRRCHRVLNASVGRSLSAVKLLIDAALVQRSSGGMRRPPFFSV